MTDAFTGTSMEDVEAAMAQILGTGSEDALSVGSEPEPAPEPSATPDAPDTPDTPDTPDSPTITLADGTVITAEDAEKWVDFSSTLSDPRFQRAYEEAFSEPELSPVAQPQQPAAAQPAAPPQLSEELRYELDTNPLAKMLWERLQDVDSRTSGITQQVDQVQQALSLTEQRNAYSIVNQARDNFAKERGLSPQEMDRVYDVTLRVYDLNKIVTLPVNPLTGQAEVPDPVRRLEDAFGYIYSATPEFQEREFDRRTKASTAESERKAKLTALSSSGSSAPPPTPSQAPTNPSDRRAALRDEIAAMQSGQFIQPE